MPSLGRRQNNKPFSFFNFHHLPSIISSSLSAANFFFLHFYFFPPPQDLNPLFISFLIQINQFPERKKTKLSKNYFLFSILKLGSNFLRPRTCLILFLFCPFFSKSTTQPPEGAKCPKKKKEDK